MRKVIIRLLVLILTSLVIFILWLGVSRSGLLWSFDILKPYLPSGLKIEQVHGRLAGPLELSGVSLQQADGNHIFAEKINLQWSPASLLSGKIDIQNLTINPLTIQISGDGNDSTTKADHQPVSLPHISLPLPLRIHKLLVQDINLIQQQKSQHFQQLELAGSMLFDQFTLDNLLLKDKFFQISADGHIQLSDQYRHQLNVDWRYQMDNDKQLHGQGSVSGNLISTKVIHQLDGVVEMDLQAELSNMLNELHWQAAMSIKQFDSQKLGSVKAISALPDLQGQGQFSGSGTLQQQLIKGELSAENSDLGPFQSSFEFSRSADEVIKINHFSINSRQTNSLLQATGEWIPGQQYGQTNLQMNWQHLRWPQTGDSWFNSAVGKATLKGKPDNYRITLETDNPWSQLPDSTWSLQAQGNLQGLNVTALKIDTLQGQVYGSGQLDWLEKVTWNADIHAKNIDPAVEWPEWPGSLSAHIKNSGKLERNQLSVQSEVIGVEGELRQYPVALKGRFDWLDNQLHIDRAVATSANSKITLQGKVAQDLALQWTIDSPDLSELYPATGGLLSASGQIHGSRQNPVLKSDYQIQKLHWNDIQVGHAKGSVNLDLQHWYQGKLQLKAENIQQGGVHLKTINLQSKSGNIVLTAKAEHGQFSMRAKGMLNNERWQGQLITADLKTDDWSNWRLQKPADLILEKDFFKIARLCWQSDQKSIVCSQFKQPGNNYQAEISVQQFPLTFFETLLPDGMKPEGKVNARASLDLSSSLKINGDIQLTLPEGQIHYPVLDSKVDNWPFRNGKVDISMTEKGIEMHSALTLNKQDSIAFRAWLPEARLMNLDVKQPIQARVQMNIVDIRLLGGLIPDLQQAEGEVNIDLQSSGTFHKPAFKGHVNLHDGHFKIPRLGLDIKQLSLQSQTDDFEKLNFELKAHSGKGDLLANGFFTLDKGSDWKSEFSVTGNNFEISKIPEARVRVTPDLSIKVQPGTIQIRGKVHVPYARLKPKDISTAAQVSDDVVILGETPKKDQKWLIDSRIRVTLDEKHVYFYGFGFEGHIGGNLSLEEKPGQFTRATGAINVPEGHYRAYGQRLVIENGQLLFAGGPVTNPGLDFRAVRKVNEVTAGLKVSGSLKKPVLEIFSTPAMGQTDALSYLVLGRPMETTSSQEDGQLVAKAALALGLSGGDRIARTLGDRLGLDEVRVESSENGDQASLVVGRYLSPRLYVSYGVGLIESINTFALRYQLSSKWQLQAESGEAQGADLVYTIER